MRREEVRREGDITLGLGEFGREEQSVHCPSLLLPTTGLFCGVVRREGEGRGEEGPLLPLLGVFWGVVRREGEGRGEERPLLPRLGLFCGVQSTEGLSMAPLRGLPMGEL